MAITKRKVLMLVIRDSVVYFLEDADAIKITDDEVKVLITCMSNMVGTLLDPNEINEVYKNIAEELKFAKIKIIGKKTPKKKK